MVAIPTYTSYELSNSTLVPVIASFDPMGNIAPLYVRINHEPYKILYYHRIDVLGIPTFNCKIEFYGRCREIKLTYHFREHIWTLKREESH